MNDLARMHCSEEVVVMGIIRVVEELHNRRPDARIVINSMLPMHAFRGGAFPMQNDYRDAFRPDPQNIRAHFPGDNSGDLPRTYTLHGGKHNRAVQAERDEDNDALVHKRDRFPGEGRALQGHLRQMNVIDRKKAKLDQQRQEIERQHETQKAQMEKVLRQHLKKDEFNPVLHDQNQFKKFDPKALYLHQTQIPLWPAILKINSVLHKFADKHEKVSFFDATDLFATRRGPYSYTLLSEMISPRGHPTEMGFKKWEDAVVHRLELMTKKAGQNNAVPEVQSSAEELQTQGVRDSEAQRQKTEATGVPPSHWEKQIMGDRNSKEESSNEKSSREREDEKESEKKETSSESESSESESSE